MSPLVPVVQVMGPMLDSRDGGNWASLTSTLCRVTFPVLVIVKVYVTVWPTVDTAGTLAVLTTEMPGVGVAITVAVEVAHTGLLELGGVPLTVPVSVMEPLSMSAWVTV